MGQNILKDPMPAGIFCLLGPKTPRDAAPNINRNNEVTPLRFRGDTTFLNENKAKKKPRCEARL
jgi:hypothetical protein